MPKFALLTLDSETTTNSRKGSRKGQGDHTELDERVELDVTTNHCSTGIMRFDKLLSRLSSTGIYLDARMMTAW